MKTYKIVRIYKDGHDRKILRTGLTLSEAREHCKDDDTSSATAYSIDAMENTRTYGPWFDGYESEDNG